MLHIIYSTRCNASMMRRTFSEFDQVIVLVLSASATFLSLFTENVCCGLLRNRSKAAFYGVSFV